MADDEEIKLGGYPLSEIVRRVRRTADFSQRELAKYASVSPASVAAIEAGRRRPSLTVLQRVLNAANYQLVVVDGVVGGCAPAPTAVPLASRVAQAGRLAADGLSRDSRC